MLLDAARANKQVADQKQNAREGIQGGVDRGKIVMTWSIESQAEARPAVDR